jgi:DNA-binding transcriptional LysR family regulator
MEIRQLEYFVAVVEEANFTRAAERVRVSQSGISAQIRQLEKGLGQSLLDRSGRAVRPTEAGAAMLPYARAALAAVSGARLAVDEIGGLTRGHVRVGMVTACSVGALFDLLADFHDAYPGVDIALSEDLSDRLVGEVQDGRLDLALVGAAGPPPDGLEAITLADEALVLAVPRGHPLATRGTVRATALDDLAVVTMPVGSGVRSALDQACRRAGAQPRIAFEASTPDAVTRLARRGLGVAVLTESMAGADSGLHAVALTDRQARARLDFVWSSHAAIAPASRALIAMLRTGTPTPVQRGASKGRVAR